jgi:hypothetical protein
MLRVTSRRIGVRATQLTVAVGLILSTASCAAPDYRFSQTFNAQPVRWNPCVTIHYRVNLDGLVPASELQQVRAAFAEAGRALHTVFFYDGPTTQIPQRDDARTRQARTQIVFAFALPGVGARRSSALTGTEVGVGGFVTRGFPGVMPTVIAGAAVINASQFPSETRAARDSSYLHEVGHVVGLGHIADPTQVMNPSIPQSPPTHYGTGDLAGLRKLGRLAGCLRT